MPLRRRYLLALPLIGLLLAADAERTPQPEDKLLDPARLRDELLQRGMTTLLDAYLEQCPPQSPAEKLIYERQRQLLIYNDKSRDDQECLAALDRAIELLARAIKEHPDDPRAMDWRLQLGKDLIYKRAEPYYNNILFRGGSKEDRERLLAITREATQAFDGLLREIDQWNQKLQTLSESELRKLQNSGELQRYRTLELQSRYFASWARFYRALATPPGAERDKMLEGIITYFTVEKKDWIEIAHKESGVQAQSLLLLGMTYRLAGRAEKAMTALDQAVKTVEALPDPAEQRSLQWVAHLGRMEQVKVLRDAGQYDDALSAIRTITKGLAEEPQSLSVELAAALLEGSIYRKQAEEALESKNQSKHDALMARSRQPLIALANRRPRAKAQIYASLYPLLGKDPDPKKLGPFDQSVLIAGLLTDAATVQQKIDQLTKQVGEKPSAAQGKQLEQLRRQRNETLGRAIATCELLLADGAELARQLHPEAMFNLGVCHFQRGDSLQAVKTFTKLVDAFPSFERSKDAAMYGVQIAAEMNRDPANADRPEVRNAFIDALEALTQRFADTPEAQYWRFYLANTLELAGKTAEAAEQYAKVEPSHENYLDARYYRVNCLMRLHEAAVAQQGADAGKIREQAARLIVEAQSCAEQIGQALTTVEDKDRRRELEQSAGDVLLMAAQVANDPGAGSADYEQTLKILDGFESRFEAYRGLIGRAMRLKIVALQGLDRLDQARQLIPDYVKRDPENAGATLGALLASMQREVRRARERNQPQAAQKAAAEAVELAKWLHQWAVDNQSRLKPGEVFSITVQYAQACLDAGQNERALELFQQCYETNRKQSPDGRATHGPTVYGLAESHYRLGQRAAEAGKSALAREHLSAASKDFMALWRRTKRRTDLWWRALLRALEVPVALRELTVSELEQAKRSGQLGAEGRDKLKTIPSMLDRIRQTISAERMTDNDLGGYEQQFRRLEMRAEALRRRVELVGP